MRALQKPKDNRKFRVNRGNAVIQAEGSCKMVQTRQLQLFLKTMIDQRAPACIERSLELLTAYCEVSPVYVRVQLDVSKYLPTLNCLPFRYMCSSIAASTAMIWQWMEGITSSPISQPNVQKLLLSSLRVVTTPRLYSSTAQPMASRLRMKPTLSRQRDSSGLGFTMAFRYETKRTYNRTLKTLVSTMLEVTCSLQATSSTKKATPTITIYSKTSTDSVQPVARKVLSTSLSHAAHSSCMDCPLSLSKDCKHHSNRGLKVRLYFQVLKRQVRATKMAGKMNSTCIMSSSCTESVCRQIQGTSLLSKTFRLLFCSALAYWKRNLSMIESLTTQQVFRQLRLSGRLRQSRKVIFQLLSIRRSKFVLSCPVILMRYLNSPNLRCRWGWVYSASIWMPLRWKLMLCLCIILKGPLMAGMNQSLKCWTAKGRAGGLSCASSCFWRFCTTAWKASYMLKQWFLLVGSLASAPIWISFASSQCSMNYFPRMRQRRYSASQSLRKAESGTAAMNQFSAPGDSKYSWPWCTRYCMELWQVVKNRRTSGSPCLLTMSQLCSMCSSQLKFSSRKQLASRYTPPYLIMRRRRIWSLNMQSMLELWTSCARSCGSRQRWMLEFVSLRIYHPVPPSWAYMFRTLSFMVGGEFSNPESQYTHRILGRRDGNSRDLVGTWHRTKQSRPRRIDKRCVYREEGMFVVIWGSYFIYIWGKIEADKSLTAELTRLNCFRLQLQLKTVHWRRSAEPA